ncbi:hypothetical protein FACS1894127_0490 [Clostridia bacterium]|nr:hypothetical protein FACS1894127_0490 [Clostridia bacterium]
MVRTERLTRLKIKKTFAKATRAFITTFLCLALLLATFSVANAESDALIPTNAPTVMETNSESVVSDNSDTPEKSEGFLGLSYSDIINTALGAFLGFFASLCVENWLRKRRRGKCIVNIALELMDLKCRIEESLNITDIPSALSYKLYTPIWETIIGNGDILELKNKPYYNTLFKAYNSITKLSRLEDGTRENTHIDICEIVGMRKAVLALLNAEPLNALMEKYGTTR